jgi:hypothetical protein
MIVPTMPWAWCTAVVVDCAWVCEGLAENPASSWRDAVESHRGA